jgi:hypothetical protein
MRKRILLLDFILLAVGGLLCADGANAAHFDLDNSPATVHSQPANLMITGTGHFSILDTRQQWNSLNNSRTLTSSPTPAFKMDKPMVPVPEPTHYALMGLGIIGLFLARRDRRNAKKE